MKPDLMTRSRATAASSGHGTAATERRRRRVRRDDVVVQSSPRMRGSATIASYRRFVDLLTAPSRSRDGRVATSVRPRRKPRKPLRTESPRPSRRDRRGSAKRTSITSVVRQATASRACPDPEARALKITLTTKVVGAETVPVCTQAADASARRARRSVGRGGAVEREAGARAGPSPMMTRFARDGAQTARTVTTSMRPNRRAPRFPGVSGGCSTCSAARADRRGAGRRT